GSSHVKVGHCQALIPEIPSSSSWVFFCLKFGVLSLRVKDLS
ncbi:MAG: hypothetical protein ACI823_002141, partial [Chitinophagales bacterium]